MKEHYLQAQNWPRDERDLWTADDRDHALLSADYRQVEAALTAYFARDAEQTEIVLAGGNLHAISAASLYGCEPTAEAAKTHMVMKAGREESAYQATKEFRHGRNFLMGPQTLSRRFGFTFKEAKRLIRADDLRWPAVARWRPAAAWEARRNGGLVNPFGRPLYSHAPFRGTNIEKWADAREFVAFLPQSTAGEMFKLALADVPPEVVWGAAHDSITLHIPSGDVLEWARRLKKTMERPWAEMAWKPWYPSGFFCRVELTVGYSWGAKERVEI